METLNNIGYALRAADRVGDALTGHQQVLALAGELGFRYEQARAHPGLGSAYQALGHRDRASHHWRGALERFTRLGCPTPVEVRAGPGRDGVPHGTATRPRWRLSRSVRAQVDVTATLPGPLRGHRLQYEHRDLAGGLLLILGVLGVGRHRVTPPGRLLLAGDLAGAVVEGHIAVL